MTATTTFCLAEYPDAEDGRTYLVIGPLCWGRAVRAKEALRLARANFSRSFFQPGYKPPYQLVDVPTDTYVTDDGGFKMPTKDCTYRWVGAFSGTGRPLPNATDPFYSFQES